MINSQWSTIYFLILYTLVVSNCIVLPLNSVDAQVNSNTLESAVSQTGTLRDSAQINVEGIPQYIYGDLYRSDTIYVTNYANKSGSGILSVIDTTTNTVTHDIRVGNTPRYIYGDLSSLKAVYVANSGSGTVSVIDSTNNTFRTNIPVGTGPEYIYGDPYRLNSIYVANTGSGTVSVINPSNNTVIENITVGPSPRFIYGDHTTGYIYVANSDSGTLSVINPSNNTVIENITVGPSPRFIYGDFPTGDIYVANSGNDTVSVINPSNNTVIKNITVGPSPRFIFSDYVSIYVANSGNDTVSVINPSNNTVIKNITVGPSPRFIYGDHSSDSNPSSSAIYSAIYVANSGNDTVSVINPSNNTVIKNIIVGKSPQYIFGDPFSDAIYVANSGSEGISVINSVTNEVVTGLIFNVIPFGAGDINCDTDLGGLDAPINRILYVSSGTICIAKPNKGFEFASWVELLDGNSTRTISTTATSSSPWTAILDFLNIRLNDPAAASPFTSFLHVINVTSDDPASTLTINRFGNFTAYFRALPPPIPAEYLATLFGVSATAVIGAWLIPTGIGWFRSRKQSNTLNSYHREIASIYADRRLDEKSAVQPNTLNDNLFNAYTEGKIDNDQYMNLKNKIMVLNYEEYRRKIGSINESLDIDLNQETNMNKIYADISDAYSTGMISKEHYTSLKNEISIAYQELYTKRIDSLKESHNRDVNREVLMDRTKEEITNAYSKGKISELHYDLLNEKISKVTSKDDNRDSV